MTREQYTFQTISHIENNPKLYAEAKRFSNAYNIKRNSPVYKDFILNCINTGLITGNWLGDNLDYTLLNKFMKNLF